MMWLRNQARYDNAWTSVYSMYRKYYHLILKQKIKTHKENSTMTKIINSENRSHMFLKNNLNLHIPLPFSTEQIHKFLEEIFHKNNLNEVGTSTYSQCGSECEVLCFLNSEITHDEIEHAIRKLKNKKSPGPDRICNEVIKNLKNILTPFYQTLFNKILSVATLPHIWKTSKLILTFKGKGEKHDLNNYRTLAMQCTQFKLLSMILNNRISLHISNLLPDEQYGFRRGRSTKDAIKKLIEAVQFMRDQKKPLYCIFADFSSAFNLTNRHNLLEKMQHTFNIHGPVLNLVKEILNNNILKIDINNEIFEITQNIGTPQGDCLSSTNFIMDTADLIEDLKTTGCDVGAYADDVAFYSENKAHVEKALKVLETWCDNSGMILNANKTKAMKFRNRGRLKKDDSFNYKTEEIEITNEFNYLGVTFQTTGTTFTTHIERRVNKIVNEMHLLTDLKLLSLNTALQIFYMKLAPIMEYCLPTIWNFLSSKNLQRIDYSFLTFLKYVCGLPINSKNRLTLLICDTPTFVTTLKMKYNLDHTESYTAYLASLNDKIKEVPEEFFLTPAMTQNRWKEAMNEERHVVTRHAIHGFHHKICTNKTFHHAQDTCRCVLCGQPASQYHILYCSLNKSPLREFANE